MESQLLTACTTVQCSGLSVPPGSALSPPFRWLEVILTWGCLLMEQDFHLFVGGLCFQEQRAHSYEGNLGDILWLLGFVEYLSNL